MVNNRDGDINAYVLLEPTEGIAWRTFPYARTCSSASGTAQEAPQDHPQIRQVGHNARK